MSANTATKIPAINQIKGLPPLAVMALQAIKETLEVREGLHEPLDRFISVRELADLILEDEQIVTYLGSGHSHDSRYYTKTQWNLTAKGDLNVAQGAGVPGTLAVGTNNQLIRADSGAALGIEYFSLLGTSNQVTVTHNASDATLSLPQNIHSGASPTFNALTLSNIAAGVADYDKFIVSDGGLLKYRTGAEVLSDIGGAPHAFKTITGITNDVVADLAEDTLTLAVGNNKLSILGTAASDTVTFTINEGNIDHNSLLNTHNLTSDIDHGSISGLADVADHAYALLITGARPLTGDWDIGAGRKISGETIQARSSSGLSLKDDGGNLGIFIEDGGKVGIGGITNPSNGLDVKASFGIWNATETRGFAQAWHAEYSDWAYYNGSGWTYPLGIADTKAHLGTVSTYDGWIGIGNLAVNEVQAGGVSGLKLTDDAGTLGVFVEDGGKVGIRTSSPQTDVDVAGRVRTTATGDDPASGTGVEIFYHLTANQGHILTYDRTNLVYKPLKINNTLLIDADGDIGIRNSDPAHPLDITGFLRASGEIISTKATGSAQFRAVSGNYGVLFRNDGSNFYLFSTASGDQYGSWSALRPFSFSVTTGDVTLGHLLRVKGNTIRLDTSKTPASAGASGNTGDICWDSSNIYVCVATNTWKKVVIAW